MQAQFDRQYPVYAFDTACFYTDEETALDRELQTLRVELKNKTKDGIAAEEKSRIGKAIGDTKDALKRMIDDNQKLVREVRPEKIRVKNVVQVFESCLTRCLDMKPNDINEAMIIVKVYYFGVAESIIKNGFNMNGNHYVFFSASAGQIRTKKFVALREDLLNACMNTLTCGLSVDQINAKGGINITKFLAYLALSNSSTEVWKDFNVNRCIVVDDFETVVRGQVDFVDEKAYSITRKEYDVPIKHTDGCGMILPALSSKNFMVRAPWIKGLLSPFPFDTYIRHANQRDPARNHALIKDIYGVEHNVLAERIQVIFTKSQFKLWEYYSNWDEYKANFKKHHCTAGKCNIEPGIIKRATINYQMLQTLTSMTDEEIERAAAKTNRTLENIATDKKTMLRAFGLGYHYDRLTPFQQCLNIYPELLQDEYCRNELRELKKSIENDGRSGKLMIDGKYQFLIPDLYAACQHWFDGIDVPEGLLADGEVWTRQYQNKEKLDVLRSPHLYKEHAIRNNVYATKTHIKKWFNTNGIYTSTYDTISRILQFDNDGDKALVVAEPAIIEAAERECADVVPLYYPMAKADPAQLNAEAFYDGMVAAWTGGNIGIISNAISRIWNSDAPDVDAVKILCMINNFVIDYAKTLYKPTTPPEWEERLAHAYNGKLPAFFEYAKSKTEKQVKPRGNGIVDRLYDKIPIKRFRFDCSQLGKFDYKTLMYNQNITYGAKEDQIVMAFRNGASTIGSNRGVGAYQEDSQYWLAIKNLRNEMQKYGTRQYVVDVLIEGLFHQHKTPKKAAFWDCFGSTVFDNLQVNIPAGTRTCDMCGNRFIPKNQYQYCCESCDAKRSSGMLHESTCVACGNKYSTRRKGEDGVCPACVMFKNVVDEFNGKEMDVADRRKDKGLCVDCGVPITRSSTRGRPSTRCAACQTVRDNLKKREWKRLTLKRAAKKNIR